ncbi:aminoacyl-tRNA hydrolase [Candidatus Parcubacteria bacterium]|nr:aminoacyl-tRNA hydrolase [Candidatus Parcubacteria bacterium]
MYTIVGLGNPGAEYAETRHNTGRLALEVVEKREIPKLKVVHLDTFMNKSGSGVAKAIKSKKAAEKLIVIYDDLDLPLGTMKISYDRGSGGHKGVESIINAVKTKAFIRIRIGIGKKTDVDKHILGKFTPKEMLELKKIFKKVADAVEVIVAQGYEKGMTEFNN